MKRFWWAGLPLVIGGWLLLSGCAGTPKAAAPAAVEEAERNARQAAGLQAAGNWRGALSAWQRAGRQFQLINRLPDLATARHNEAVCRRELGDLRGARALAEEAAALNGQLGRSDDRWRNEFVLVQLDRAEGAGRERLESLSALPASAVSARFEALLAHERACWDLREGDPAAARDAAAQARAGFERLGDRISVATAQVTRGQALLDLGEAAAAEVDLREALATFSAAGHARGVATALGSLSESVRAQGRVAEADLLRERAVENLRVLGREAEAARWAEPPP